MSLCNGRTLLYGDFNLPYVDWTQGFANDTENSVSQLFFDKFSDLFLCQHVCEATRARDQSTPHCLDLLLTSSEANVTDVKVLRTLRRADHNVVT